MKNKKRFIIGLIMLIIGVIFLFLLIFDPFNVNATTTEDYESNKEEIINVLKGNIKEDAIIYLGSINNNNVTTILNTYNNGIKTYYLDIENEKTVLEYNKKVIVKKEGSSFYKKLLNILGAFSEIYALENEYNEPVNSGYKTIHTPFLIYLKNGKIVYTYYITTESDESIKQNIINGFKEME